MNNITRRAAILGTIGAVAGTTLPACGTGLVGPPMYGDYGKSKERLDSCVAYISHASLVSMFFMTLQSAQAQALRQGVTMRETERAQWLPKISRELAYRAQGGQAAVL